MRKPLQLQLPLPRRKTSTALLSTADGFSSDGTSATADPATAAADTWATSAIEADTEAAESYTRHGTTFASRTDWATGAPAAATSSTARLVDNNTNTIQS